MNPSRNQNDDYIIALLEQILNAVDTLTLSIHELTGMYLSATRNFFVDIAIRQRAKYSCFISSLAVR